MKVKTLMKLLSEFDPETRVVFAYDYGDRQHSMVVENIADVVDENIVWSDYHRMHKIVDEYDDYDEKHIGVVRLVGCVCEVCE